MAADIIPIQLGLTAGNVFTLWAPRWREDGEEWEAFLGHGDHVYGFPSPAHLAAFIRTENDHDLIDHPEWAVTADLMADELAPDDDHIFDLVGVPDLVAEAPDIWALAELSDTVAILRSLASVCDLPVIDEVLDSADGFSVLGLGEQAFAGRQGEKLWDGIGAVVVKRWDKVIDTIDAVFATPEVDESALDAAEAEIAAVEAAAFDPQSPTDDGVPDEPAERAADLAFWDEIGIDCVSVTIGGRTGATMRCYLDDQPVFLSAANRIQLFTADTALERFITDGGDAHALADLEVWAEVREAVAAGRASVLAGPENVYRVDGLAEGLLTGPGGVDRRQLGLAVELLTDAATARRDEETAEALTTATPLSNLIRAVVTPDSKRLPPAPPFDDEVGAWSILVDKFAESLDWDGISE